MSRSEKVLYGYGLAGVMINFFILGLCKLYSLILRNEFLQTSCFILFKWGKSILIWIWKVLANSNNSLYFYKSYK
jgi:hypothetical protein